MAEDPPPLWEAIVTLVMIVLMFIVLALERFPSDFVMLFTLILFLPLGILTPKEATAGFGNDSMLTVMALLIVTASLVSTGGLELIKRLVYSLVRNDGSKSSYDVIVAVVLTAVGVLSAFVANTPIVSMFIPFMQDLAARFHVAPSKLLLPLSYAAILGGTCSLIGTTTNLVALGLAQKADPLFQMGMMDMAQIGVPVLLAGLLYVLVCGPLILPNRGGVTRTVANPREYLVTLVVAPRSAVSNRTIEKGGLRSLPGLYLTHLTRGDELIPAPGPDTVLLAGDRITFAGNVDAVVGLTRIRGLTLCEDDDHADLTAVPGDKTLVEAVVAPRSEMAGKSVRDIAFRSRFNAAIIAVHRNGERIDHQRIGDIVLHGGDTLLLITRAGFVDTNRTNTSFSLVRAVDQYVVVRHSRAPLSILALIVLITVSAAADVALFTCSAFAGAFLMITRCLTPKEARDAIKLDLMIMIACGFGISQALVNSGAARLVADGLIAAAAPTGFTGLVIVVYVVTTVFNAAVTNNAAVAIMFPVTWEVARASGYPFLPLLYTLMFAGSADFSTPYGYNTNLMVYGPGGYRFIDYVKFGMPLQLICAVIAIGVILTMEVWWIWTVVIFVIDCIAVALMVVFSKRRHKYEPEAGLPLGELPISLAAGADATLTTLDLSSPSTMAEQHETADTSDTGTGVEAPSYAESGPVSPSTAGADAATSAVSHPTNAAGTEALPSWWERLSLTRIALPRRVRGPSTSSAASTAGRVPTMGHLGSSSAGLITPASTDL